jgi:Uma2 family endonuclease
MISSSSPTLQNFVTDTWVKASWEEFIALADNPIYENGRFYYHQGSMRIEMLPVGFRHGRYHSILSYLVILFAGIENIPIVEFTNTSFRKVGLDEFQPDLSFYIKAGLKVPPETNSPINLNEYNPPTLVVEIGSSSISDDLGRKRLLYERSGIQEYWVIDATAREVTAFTISDRRSGEIEESLVLPGLRIALVNEALQRSQTEDDGAITRWLLQTFSQS